MYIETTLQKIYRKFKGIQMKNRKISKADIEEILEGIPSSLEKFGGFLIGIGKLEKKIGPVEELMEKFNPAEIEKALTALQKKGPKLAAKLASLMTRFFFLAPKLETPSKLTPDEKIRVGTDIVEICQMMREIFGAMKK